MKPWKMKRNTYMILPEADQWSLFVCLGIRKSKLFDYGIGYRQSNNTIKWKGLYGKTAHGWEGLVQSIDLINCPVLCGNPFQPYRFYI